MRHQVGLERLSTTPIFAEPFGDLSPVCRVVGSGAVVRDVFSYLFPKSAFFTDGVYRAPILRSLYLSSGWWPLLKRPICSFRDNLDSSLRSSFSSFMPYTRRILIWEIFPPSGSTPDGGLRRVVVVSNMFLISCSFFSGLFVSHLISHYPAVAWAPDEGYLVPFIMEGSKEA